MGYFVKGLFRCGPLHLNRGSLVDLIQRDAILAGGALDGSFDEAWRQVGSYWPPPPIHNIPRVSAPRLPRAAAQGDAYLEVMPGRLNGPLAASVARARGARAAASTTPRAVEPAARF
jgi:hypothetical protein